MFGPEFRPQRYHTRSGNEETQHHLTFSQSVDWAEGINGGLITHNSTRERNRSTLKSNTASAPRRSQGPLLTACSRSIRWAGSQYGGSLCCGGHIDSSPAGGRSLARPRRQLKPAIGSDPQPDRRLDTRTAQPVASLPCTLR